MKDKLTICGFTLAIIAGIALLLIAADILTVDKDGTVKFRVRDTGAIGLERLSANPASLNDGDVWHAPTQYTDLGSGYEYTMPVVKYADNGATRPLAPMTDADLTLYVDASRPDDSGNGLTPATAKKSIQSAVNLIPPVVRHNVTIDVAAGTYTATGGTIGSSTSNVVVSGKDVAQGVGITFQGDLVNDPLADPPVLDRIVDGNGKNNCFYVNGVSNVVIKGLQVKNSTDRGIFYATFASGTVENCAVSSIGSNGVGIGVNNYMFSKVNVTNSLIRNCGANAISYLTSSQGSVTNSTIKSSYATGILYLVGCTGSASNCTISGNGTSGSGYGIYVLRNCYVSAVTNNIIGNAGDGIRFAYGSTGTATQNTTNGANNGLYGLRVVSGCHVDETTAGANPLNGASGQTYGDAASYGKIY